jgi:Holliday junction resolvase RusA-like endonuclease
MTEPLLIVTVPGLPQPQGSTRAFVRGGRAIVTSDNPKLSDWRHRLTLAITYARAGRQTLPYAGPVRLHLRFFLPRPKSLPKATCWPTTRPDLDKLTRAVNDALTDSGVWKDDSQLVELTATKGYAQDTELPGVEIIAIPLPGRKDTP